MCLQPPVVRRGRRVLCIADDVLRPDKVTRLHERVPELGEDLEPRRIGRREQVGGAGEQRRRGRHVASRERPSSGGGERGSRAPAEG